MLGGQVVCSDRCGGCCADNFKPGGVDATKPGSIEVRKGQENTSVVVERGSEKACAFNLPSADRTYRD